MIHIHVKVTSTTHESEERILRLVLRKIGDEEENREMTRRNKLGIEDCNRRDRVYTRT
jgi:hypothetical protein